ncbi:MAG: hypothetical protein JW697_09610 [Kosmotogaceae bacterium]|nr:hypothetical protein [Kosmotogaceae bacterium]
MAFPRQMISNYRYRPVEGKIVIDLFYNAFCSKSDIEAHRVMNVARGFGDLVLLNSHEIEEPGIKERYGSSRVSS